jgi:hypothetical protein
MIGRPAGDIHVSAGWDSPKPTAVVPDLSSIVGQEPDKIREQIRGWLTKISCGGKDKSYFMDRQEQARPTMRCAQPENSQHVRQSAPREYRAAAAEVLPRYPLSAPERWFPD